MNRKSQVQAIREIFQFGLGIVLLVLILFMFNNSIIPTVADYALTLEADNINSHVNYLVSELLSVVNQDFIDGSFELTYRMPGSIQEYKYTTYFTSGELCTLMDGTSINNCINYDFNADFVEGVYFSGGDLTITVTKSKDITSIILSN